jgi:hypothetical protein
LRREPERFLTYRSWLPREGRERLGNLACAWLPLRQDSSAEARCASLLRRGRVKGSLRPVARERKESLRRRLGLAQGRGQPLLPRHRRRARPGRGRGENIVLPPSPPGPGARDQAHSDPSEFDLRSSGITNGGRSQALGGSETHLDAGAGPARDQEKATAAPLWSHRVVQQSGPGRVRRTAPRLAVRVS